MKIIELKVLEEFENMTVDKFLRLNGFSRNLITKLKKTDMGISIDNELVFTNYKLCQGQTLSMKILDELSSENIIPVNLPLDIVYEDDDILVINKQMNMPCHPSKGNYDNTLGNALCYYFKDKPFVFRVINRLDRDTTGLLIVAKHMLAGAILSEMVKHHKIHREYLAVCREKAPLNGIINAPIKRAYEGTIERIVDFSNGDEAITFYERKFFKNSHSLMKVKLKTGRTHQIRVHMKHIGFPLVGDFLYNPDYSHISRQALHSFKLKFLHPITKKEMIFIKPLPDDMRNIFK